MSKRLYRVEVSAYAYVLSDSEVEAEREAITALRTCPDGCSDLEGIAVLIRNVNNILPEWRDALPFGAQDGDERTIRQILEEETVNGEDARI